MAIETKFALPYSLSFMAEMDEKILKLEDQKPHLLWRYIDENLFHLGTWARKVKEVLPLN